MKCWGAPPEGNQPSISCLTKQFNLDKQNGIYYMRQSLQILLVEDEEPHSELIQRAFQKTGNSVKLTVALNLEEARTFINNVIPDLLITDWLLPDGKGIELLPEDKERFPVIIMTSHGNEEIAVEVMKAGVLDYVVKSVESLKEMPHIAQSALRVWEQMSERKQAEAALQESEKRYYSIITAMSEGILFQEAAGVILSCNTSAERILGLENQDIINQPYIELFQKVIREDKSQFLPEKHPAMITLETGQPLSNIIMGIYKINNDLTWISMNSQPLFQENARKPYAVVVSFTDISIRKLAEDKIISSLKEKEVLMREIHHRVKNNLQIISSLLRLQSSYIKNDQLSEMLKDSESRIEVMSLVHEKLYLSKDLASIDSYDYIIDLVNEIYSFYEISANIKLNLDIEHIFLDIDLAVPCGLIISELISNSLKHAFPNNRQGELNVSFSLNENDNNIKLVISDNGIGFPGDVNFKNTNSLGLQLVTNLVEKQLHGTVEQSIDTGTNYSIYFQKARYKKRV